ncbi:BgTH12-06195 [Blumeria graminis f. sp. triticale]|uniref:BgTH12-06195 n=1 Tax=Blumeria graminis f. sp. triticale TaxID=1689686 RepID=A0A9W4D5H3_BLUGR|nr:BgTH12-06195 [Blumeria graminis f. sp. triticale]
MIACSTAPALLRPVPKALYFFDVLLPLSRCY